MAYPRVHSQSNFVHDIFLDFDNQIGSSVRTR